MGRTCGGHVGLLGCQVPNGELSSKQLRFLGDQIAHLGAKGCADITTRANIQLRGMDLADSAAIFEVHPYTVCAPLWYLSEEWWYGNACQWRACV